MTVYHLSALSRADVWLMNNPLYGISNKIFLSPYTRWGGDVHEMYTYDYLFFT